MRSEAIIAAKKTVYMNKEFILPKALRGKIEIYILLDGDVGIHPIKKKKK